MTTDMDVEVVGSDELPHRAAAHLAQRLRDAVAARGQATLAVSGGSTPARMFAALVDLPVPWGAVHLLQVDERLAPDGDPDRNATVLERELVERLPAGLAGFHPFPVAALLEPSAEVAVIVAEVEAELARLSGVPPVIDVVHLGLGSDGHTASLVPDDDVLEVRDHDVAITSPYQGHRRITLTFPVLERARHRVWLVAGADKVEALHRLVRADEAIPAGRLPLADATLLADHAAYGGA